MTGKNNRKKTADEAVAHFVRAAVEAQAVQATKIAELRGELDAAKFVINLQAAEIAELRGELDAAQYVIDLQAQVLAVY